MGLVERDPEANFNSAFYFGGHGGLKTAFIQRWFLLSLVLLGHSFGGVISSQEASNPLGESVTVRESFGSESEASGLVTYEEVKAEGDRPLRALKRKS